MCLIALLVIHLNFAYPTNPSWIPDPFLRIYLDRAHKTKHGSDTGTFDHEGRFIPQSFEDIFAKYAGGRDYMTLDEMWDMLAGQRLVSDFIGWCGAIFECKYCATQSENSFRINFSRGRYLHDVVA